MQSNHEYPKIHFQKYAVVEQLGKGSFGTVYKALQLQNANKLCAIKFQTIGTVRPMLHLEYELLAKLKQEQQKLTAIDKGFSVPLVFEHKEDDYLSYMAMELLDITLEDFANKQMKNTFSKDCLIRIFYDLLKIIQFLHNLSYIHRDIKPANFMLRLNPKSSEMSTAHSKYLPCVYPIDLGLSKSYLNPITKQHIHCKENKKMVGTAVFCSLNTHMGLEQSRRDDIQALVYLVAYLVKKLPWELNEKKEQSLIAKKKAEQKQQKKEQPLIVKKKGEQKQQKQRLEKYQEIHQIKRNTNFNDFLNDQSLFPKCLLQIYKIAIKMQFDEQPDYPQLFEMLEKQHFQLTGLEISLRQFPCKWENLTVQKKEEHQLIPSEKKTIKINFKIPSNKIKKPTLQNPSTPQSQQPTLQSPSAPQSQLLTLQNPSNPQSQQPTHYL